MKQYPFKHILLATEHTEFDSGAERMAFAMAQRCGIPLHVVVPLLSNPEYEAEMPELALRAEQAVAANIAQLRKQAEALGVQIDVKVRRGEAIHTAIVAEATESQADLIVIRRRGKPSFLARMLVGEMVSKVIRDTSCNVLLVPRVAEFWKHHILAAVGNTPAASTIARTAGIIAGICELPLTVLSVAHEQESVAAMQQLNAQNVALATSVATQVQGEVRVGKPVEQIISTVKETKADLVIIGRQRYHLLPFGDHGIMQNIAGTLNVSTLVVAA